MTTPVLSPAEPRTAWAGIAVLMATSFILVTAEFLPPSLLPTMAASLGITEGQAGQAVTATAIIGFLTAPTIGIIFPRLDRRTLLAGLALAAAVSNILVALAPNLILLLIARLLLGAAIGGFWAMSIAVTARLARPRHLGRALMLVNTGTTVATVAGVPLGIFLGSIFDWRVVFAAAAALSLIVAVLLRSVLPPVAPAASTGFRALGETLRVPGMPLGLLGHVLVVLGHFAAFTYIRLALERVPGIDAGGIAALLAAFGLGGVFGNFIVGLLVDRHLALMRFLVPALIGGGIAALTIFPGQLWIVVIAVALWGIGFGAWLLVVSTWMGRLAPERMEAGGGLLVAGFQLAITIGAGIGGLLVDGVGIAVTLVAAAISTLLGGALFGAARHTHPASASPAAEAVPVRT
ncbi:MFS transporter [Mycetocola spongiae]|uniref:MFS transporter n=1 Tax=Mycetocola spongiae TaxID=2859226 RepID=UPI001CF4BA06|nr:MFS transporter [Mycetocola spongiae]UCR88086.1 MFS transporter [Mycetocola spongiae]